MTRPSFNYISILLLSSVLCRVDSFSIPAIPVEGIRSPLSPSPLWYSNSWDGDGDDDDGDAHNSNTWPSSTYDEEEDWDTKFSQRQDSSYWSESPAPATPSKNDTAEELLDILASQGSTEVAFNDREAERADKVRQMEERGFKRSTIASVLDVAVEELADVGVQRYWEDSYLDMDDPLTVESHAKVPRDPDTNEPVRSQMVYVDEHACIGCTNCAMIAQSTFFMQEEHGRARVFEQWADDDETIQTAIDTCPVDCIHYLPYPELVQLEVQRRDQNINVLAGLVSRAERGSGSGISSSTPRSFGNQQFTAAPRVSRTYDNEDALLELKAKEELRLFKDRRRRLEEERRQDNKTVDL